MTGFPVSALLLACAFFVGCSSDVVLREPAPEPEAVKGSSVKIKSLWSKSIDSDSDIPSGIFRPVLQDKVVYASGNEGEVLALDAKNGKQIWQVDLDQKLSAGVAVGDAGVVVVGRNGDVIALDLKGQELWRQSLDREIIQAPAIHQNTAVLQATNATVFALDMKTGEQRWKYSARSAPLSLRGTSQPVVYKNRVLVALDSGAVVALNINTGKLLWERKLQVPKGANEFERIVDLDGRITLQDNIAFVPGYQGFLTAIEAYTGQILWQKEVSSFRKPAFSVGRLYVTDADSNILALDSRTGEIKWQSEAFQYRELSGPKALGLQVLTSDMEGNLYVLDKSSAEVLAKRHLGKAPISIITTNTMAFSQSANGKLKALEIQQK